MPTTETKSDNESVSASTVIDMEACVQAAFEEETYPFEDDDDDDDGFVSIPLGNEEMQTTKHKSNEHEQQPQPLRTTMPLSPSSITSVVNEVLAMYRRSHRRQTTSNMSFFAANASTTDEDSTTTSSNASNNNDDNLHSLSDLCREIRHYRQEVDCMTPPEVALRVENFHKARFLRKNQQNSFRPWGLLGLFFHLVDIRQDLEWAQDAAYRRIHNLPYLSWADYEHTHQCKRQHVVHRTPWFVNFIMLACTVTLIYSLARMNWKLEDVKINPMLGPSQGILLEMGALYTPRIVANNEWYRLFAPIILHVGIIHYVLNMIVLLVLGTAVERIHGSFMTSIVFCTAAVGGNLASAIFSPHIMSVGASGGIFSLLGLCLADTWSNWDIITMKDDHGDGGVPVVGVLFFICLDICLNLSIGLTPWIDNFAHVGGFVYGTCLGIAFGERLGQSGFFGKATRTRRVGTAFCKWLAFMVVAALMVSTFGVLYTTNPERGPPNVCPGCRHISCVPFPFWKENNRWWECDSCISASGSFHQYRNGTTILKLQCPEGEKTVDIDLNTTNPNIDALRAELPRYCRKLC